jgi:hypothetical protein
VLFQAIEVSPNPTAANESRQADFQALKELLSRFHMRLADQKARIEAQRQME